MKRLNKTIGKKRSKCPTNETNPSQFVNPMKVLLQAAFFPLISRIKKMPPAKRRWNYDTASWDFLRPPPMGPNMPPGKVMEMTTPPGNSMGMKPSPEEMKKMQMMQMKMMPGEKVQKLYNCIHCNRCHTSHARIKLKQRMFTRGQVPNDFVELFRSYRKFDTPLHQDTRRIRDFKEIPKTSSTLLYIGCFSAIKSPELAEHAIEYLLKQKVDFTILEKELCCGLSLEVSGETKLFEELKDRNLKIFKERGFKEIICLCPACYNMFRKQYTDFGIKIRFISEFLTPITSKGKSEPVEIQHSCHLLYEGKKELTSQIERTLKESGFMVTDAPHWCCGGGIGLLYIPDTIEKIGRLRANDFTGPVLTTYCPSCYWMLKVYGWKEKKDYKLIDVYQLLMANG